MRARAFVVGLIVAHLGTTWVRSQVAQSDTDPNGVAIPYPFVHLVHSADSSLAGATAWLRANDPFLLYQLGRDLTHRNYSRRDGAIDRPGELNVALYVGDRDAATLAPSAVRFARDHAASCGSCHSMPPREPGAGQTIPSTGSMGRNTPHFYGAGLIEMIGLQTRALIVRSADANRDGWISRAEAKRARPAVIVPAPGEPAIDFGRLAPDAHGVPDLNPMFRVWYVDARGRPVPDALSLDDPRAAGFDLAMLPFGWGRGRRVHPDGRITAEGGEAATIRGIFTLAADVHMGLQADDRSERSAAGQGLAAVSLNGARQLDLLDLDDVPDHGAHRTSGGVSLHDADGDGYPSELTEGDLDAIEFYLLHAPAPAVRPDGGSEAGRALLRDAGCTRCHVERWQLAARDDRRGLAGDRRLFHLETSAYRDEDGVERVRGRLVRTPPGRGFVVDRIYSDFKQWDLGEGFWERRYDGTLQKEHRTAPLWGVGSTRPYGHDGRFDSLDDVIRAHGGAAARERDAYLALPEGKRELLLRYLDSLVLYATDEIPSDIDGDGVANDDFRVAGQIVGAERFDPRFLFAVPPRWRFLYDTRGPDGRLFRLGFITNLRETYRLDLPYRADADGDHFADVLGRVKGAAR